MKNLFVTIGIVIAVCSVSALMVVGEIVDPVVYIDHHLTHYTVTIWR